MKDKNPAEQKEPLTTIDFYKVREARLIAERDERNLKSRETVTKGLAEGKVIEVQIRDQEEIFAQGSREYFELKNEKGKSIAARVALETIGPEDLKEGKVTVREFYEAGRTAEQIERDARIQADKELEGPRLALKAVKIKILELREAAWKNQEGIEIARHASAVDFYNSLKSMTQHLEEAGTFSLGVTYAHQEHKKATTERLLTSGWPVVKTWELKTMEEIEALELDPIIAEEHLAAFQKVVEEIRAKGFQHRVTINYSRLPTDASGGKAGEFWYTAF